MGAPQFEWDPGKNAANKAKHGIGFEMAAYVFVDPLNISILDKLHSDFEQRWATIGIVNGQVIVVIHTYPNELSDDPVRIISARLATPAEIRYYEGDEHGRGR
jgi:uncharacterized protein